MPRSEERYAFFFLSESMCASLRLSQFHKWHHGAVMRRNGGHVMPFDFDILTGFFSSLGT
jgi:hypothetical protein